MEKKQHHTIGNDITRKYEIGIIVGRFQVHELHDAHKKLIDSVINNHNKCIIFLGVTSAGPTKRNPLDFDSRKRMLQNEYPQIMISPIKDVNNDKIWSEKLDEKIREIYSLGEPLLYGGRDSFIPHYKGNFDTAELHQEVYLSGTEVRKVLSQRVVDSSDFRAGKIYSVYNRYPISYPTVDIAPINYDRQEILLCKKPFEDKYRFVGGFVDPDDFSYEHAAHRELREEVGEIEVDGTEYVCSMNVEDWRYSNEEDKIKTILFKTRYMFGTPQPADDISEVRWFPISTFIDSDDKESNDDEISKIIVYEHIPLMINLCENLRKNDVL